MLDLIGYTADQPLYECTLLEPSFGRGDFFLPAIERLLQSRAEAVAAGKAVGSIAECMRGVELHQGSFDTTRGLVIDKLIGAGLAAEEAQQIAQTWLVHGDFLLSPLPRAFDFVVGNPPYVRQELIPAPLLNEYRRRFVSLYDRADLYVPFIERSMGLLAEEGQLCFICSDRWMKNKYGGPLRHLVSRHFHLRSHIDMVDADAFHSEVSAYPAITVIAKGEPKPTRVAPRPALDKVTLSELSSAMRAEEGVSHLFAELENVVDGSNPWILETAGRIELIRRLEADFPTLEEAGCKVGIGVATGADKIFIGKLDELDVEADRKIPLAMGRDLATGHVEWRGYGVVNPFTDEGPLVNLDDYPRLKAYFEQHRERLEARHVAKKSSSSWYRTIDRITPSLTWKPKLLIPDIRGDAQVVFDDGRLYPHHNLYFVLSEQWELRALQAVLLSNVARLFVETYSTKMRGGYLRFQAQYLRRIRIPRWETVSADIRGRLIAAAAALDLKACDEAAAELYSLNTRERESLAKKN
ncbi:Eco57I restriction-modification methylase domain-containing protein [Massilia brevitalea]|uniref:Eco57I restriction-modification methylase domain-containing protein n=1 Tax=Massilia brevitalea TaxID=442526 RepID=UPI0027389B69|nr:Eco57I restriction-modification methylase domain-containing protein [Massilia brevitalea]